VRDKKITDSVQMAFFWCVLAISLLFSATDIFKAMANGTEPAQETATYSIATPQLSNPLQPVKNLPADGKVTLHAAVATVPDPSDTSLARAFDMDLAAARA